MKVFYTICCALLNAMLILSFAAPNDEGFIYGRITTFGGETYTGTLRWETQECFWDDLFNAEKTENEYVKYVKKEKKFSPFNFAIHQFVTRFGDIESIMIKGNRKVRIKMKSGSEYDIRGYGDVGADILVIDVDFGEILVDWDKIDKIEFLPTPKKVDKLGNRLKGKVTTRVAEYSGFIMWDNEECLDIDILDGDSDDGRIKIKFGKIKSIEKDSYHSSKVVTYTGKSIILRGTNDVNNENRGIVIVDERYGRVEVPWNDFEKLELEPNEDSGWPYSYYKPSGKLSGTVEIFRRDSIHGDIVFDLDEAEGFEILNGKISDTEFYIPFQNIKSITPKTRHSSVVILKNEIELILEDSQDVSDSNNGIIIFTGQKDDPEYISWSKVERITFDN
ncbi:hypothetical protein ISS30_08345 [bacterium]|nr:hypothetical protein [bacterium]